MFALGLWFVGAVAAVMAAATAGAGDDGCSPDKMAVYRLVLHTYWTRDNFPKHYPDWKPPAQWSKLYGASHAPGFVLFRLGRRVPAAVREFAEDGRADSLLGAPPEGVLDAFCAPPVLQGAGRAEAQFFLDGNHSRVSAMVRMVPSPDWFIGVDSFDLCVDGNWLDTITIEADPLDAGTDNGFTFTAPNWPTAPQGVAYRITSRYPAHPAGSFFYPHRSRLQPVATFQFIKLREYEISNVFRHASDERRYDVLQLDKMADVDKMAENSIDVLDGNRALGIAEAAERAEEFAASRTTLPHPLDSTYYTLWSGMPPLATASSPSIPEPRTSNRLSQDTSAMLHSLARRYRARRRRKQKPNRPVDCRVSVWSAWSECAGGCGVGEAVRKRSVTRRARRGGARCPPLTQTRWCSPETCTQPPHVLV